MNCLIISFIGSKKALFIVFIRLSVYVITFNNDKKCKSNILDEGVIAMLEKNRIKKLSVISEHIGIDTIKLYFPGYNVEPISKHWNSKAKISASRDLSSLKAHYFQANYRDPETEWEVWMNGTGLYFMGNVPRINSPINVHFFYSHSSVSLFSYLKSLCIKLLLNVDIYELKINRLDIFCDFKLSFAPCLLIENLSDLFFFDRMRLTSRSEFYRYNGIKWGNKSRSFTLYDKSKHIQLKDYSIGKNFLRVEYRIHRHSICRKEKVGNFSNLTNWKNIKDIWIKQNQKFIREIEADSSFGNIKSGFDAMLFLNNLILAESLSLKEFRRAMEMMGLNFAVDNGLTEIKLNEVISKSTTESYQKSRIRSHISDLHHQISSNKKINDFLPWDEYKKKSNNLSQCSLLIE